MGLLLRYETDSGAVATYWTINPVPAIERTPQGMHGTAVFWGYVDEQAFRDGKRPLPGAREEMRVKTDQGLSDRWTLADWYHFAMAKHPFFKGAVESGPALTPSFKPEQVREALKHQARTIADVRIRALGKGALNAAGAIIRKVEKDAKALIFNDAERAQANEAEKLLKWVSDLTNQCAAVCAKIDAMSEEELAAYDIQSEGWPDFYPGSDLSLAFVEEG